MKLNFPQVQSVIHTSRERRAADHFSQTMTARSGSHASSKGLKQKTDRKVEHCKQEGERKAEECHSQISDRLFCALVGAEATLHCVEKAYYTGVSSGDGDSRSVFGGEGSKSVLPSQLISKGSSVLLPGRDFDEALKNL